MMDEMGDVNEFMEKFSDFEIKWGLAINPELEKKVKVTILATGFGVEHVEGMKDHIKDRFAQEDADAIEAQAKREDRRDRYYHDTPNQTRYRRRPHIYRFNAEDLDNENVISAVEQSPTYKRTREILENIHNQANGHPTTVDETPKEDIQGTIVFA